MIKNPWILLYTHSGKEEYAASNLANQNIEFFFPQTRIQKANGIGHKKHVTRPFFLRYLFASLTSDSLLRPLRNTRGIHSLVKFGDELALIEADVIEAIRAGHRDGFYYADDGDMDSEFGFAVDSIVKIIDLHSGWYEKLGKYKGPAKQEGYVRVEFDAPSLGKSIELVMSADSVLAV